MDYDLLEELRVIGLCVQDLGYMIGADTTSLEAHATLADVLRSHAETIDIYATMQHNRYQNGQ